MDGAVVVMLVPNSFDFLTGGGSQLVVDVDVDSPADVNVLHLQVHSICCFHKRSDDAM